MRKLAASLLLLLAACRHVPPDKEARAVEPPPAPEPPPAAAVAARPPSSRDEICGLWISEALRGRLAALGDAVAYAFSRDGSYTALFARGRDCEAAFGKWSYAAGKLTLDGGALLFDASLAGDRLTLSSPPDALLLRRPSAPPLSGG